MPKHRAKTSRRDQLVGGSEELVVEVVSLHANHRQFATFAPAAGAQVSTRPFNLAVSAAPAIRPPLGGEFKMSASSRVAAPPVAVQALPNI